MVDPLAERVDGYIAPNSTDINLFISAIFGAAWAMLNDKNNVALPVTCLVFSQAFMMFVLSSAFGVLYTNFEAKFFSIDATWGCFGFLDPNYFLICLLV